MSILFPLPLDNLNYLRCIIEDHGYRAEEKNYEKDLDYFVNPEASPRLLHLTLPIHAVFLTVRATYFHAVRGTSSMVAGVLSWDDGRFFSGIKDFVACLVELVVLPFMAIIGLFSPLRVYMWLRQLEVKEYDVPRDVDKRVLEDCFYSTCDDYRREITGVVRGITAPLIGIPDAILLSLIAILSGKYSDFWDYVVYLPVSALAPVIGLASGCLDSANKIVNGFHAIKV